jgi:hypothetical protein
MLLQQRRRLPGRWGCLESVLDLVLAVGELERGTGGPDHLLAGQYRRERLFGVPHEHVLVGAAGYAPAGALEGLPNLLPERGRYFYIICSLLSRTVMGDAPRPLGVLAA